MGVAHGGSEVHLRKRAARFPEPLYPTATRDCSSGICRGRLGSSVRLPHETPEKPSPRQNLNRENVAPVWQSAQTGLQRLGLSWARWVIGLFQRSPMLPALSRGDSFGHIPVAILRKPAVTSSRTRYRAPPPARGKMGKKRSQQPCARRQAGTPTMCRRARPRASSVLLPRLNRIVTVGLLLRRVRDHHKPAPAAARAALPLLEQRRAVAVALRAPLGAVPDLCDRATSYAPHYACSQRLSPATRS